MDKQEPAFSEEPSSETQEKKWWAHIEASRAEERRVLEVIVGAHLKEEKRARYGKNGFRLFIAFYLLALLWIGNADQWHDVALNPEDSKHTAIVDIQGPILAATHNSADTIIKGLTKAFEDPDTAGVILRINSPGGSPVQAGQVYDAIQRLQKRFPDTPFFAALEDLCASGGYYIAAAAPLIFADKATLVGSIGVILQGFGFQETLKKLGMESRVMTAGKNKAFLSPFLPMNPTDKRHAQALLDKIHAQFIEAVRQGRGDRLKTSETELFEGLIWTGEEAVTLGLVDGLGSAAWIAREKIQHKRIVQFTEKDDWLTRMSQKMGADLLTALTPRVY